MISPHLLVDDGRVVCRDQSAGAVEAMATAASMPLETFTAACWTHRTGYDGGASAADCWSDVLGRTVDGPVLERPVSLDVESWSVLDEDTLAVLTDAQDAGASLSLLSTGAADLRAALLRP